MLLQQKISYLKKIKHEGSAHFFLLEHPKVLLEVIKQYPPLIEMIFVAKSAKACAQELASLSQGFDIVEDFVIEKLSSLKTNREIICLIKNEAHTFKAKPQERYLILDTIQDPGNLGTIIRTANWFGIQQIICSNDCVDYTNAKCIQACMGAWLNTKIIYTELLPFLNTHKNIPIYASDLNGNPLNEISFEKNASCFLVLGNEARGVRPEILDRSKYRLRIAGKGNIDSLNVAVACGILLFYMQSKTH